MGKSWKPKDHKSGQTLHYSIMELHQSFWTLKPKYFIAKSRAENAWAKKWKLPKFLMSLHCNAIQWKVQPHMFVCLCVSRSDGPKAGDGGGADAEV